MKRAIVLGVSGRLGMAIAKRLVDENYSVIGSYFRSKPLESLNGLVSYKLDMEDIDSVDGFLEKIGNSVKYSFITNTIANTLTLEKFEKIELESFKKDFTINFFNYVYFLKKVIPQMEYNSNIIFVLSEMIRNPQRNFSPYISSKSALLGLMRSLSKELEPRKIRVNSVSPVKMDTEFLWKMNLGGKIIPVPIAIKEKQLETQKFLPPERVASEIMKIIGDTAINGEDFLVR